MKTKNASKVAPRNIFGTEILWTHHQTLKWQVIWRKNYTCQKKGNFFLPFLGQFNWTIAACLLLAWLLVYVCIIKGITENPIIIYITAIYPYVVLIIFLIRALTLPGMGDGIAYLFIPQVKYLNKIDVDILGFTRKIWPLFSVGKVERSYGMVRRRNPDIFLTWFGFWRPNCILFLQSCK